MEDNKKYIKSLEDNMKKYKDKLSKIDATLSEYESRGKAHLVSESAELKEKYKEAEGIVKDLKGSAAEDFEDLKNASLALFNDLKEGLSQFSSLLTMDKILHAKEEAVHYGKEKASEASDYVKKNPVTAALIALATGFVVGAFLRREK